MTKRLASDKKRESYSFDIPSAKPRIQATKVHSSGSKRDRGNPVLETTIPQDVWKKWKLSEQDSIVWHWVVYGEEFRVWITKQE